MCNDTVVSIYGPRWRCGPGRFQLIGSDNERVVGNWIDASSWCLYLFHRVHSFLQGSYQSEGKRRIYEDRNYSENRAEACEDCCISPHIYRPDFASLTCSNQRCYTGVLKSPIHALHQVACYLFDSCEGDVNLVSEYGPFLKRILAKKEQEGTHC